MTRRDASVIAPLTDVVARYPRWGFWKLFDHGGGVDAQQARQYDVAPDGRFLINTVLDDSSSTRCWTTRRRRSRCCRTGIPKRSSNARVDDYSLVVAEFDPGYRVANGVQSGALLS